MPHPLKPAGKEGLSVILHVTVFYLYCNMIILLFL